MQFVAKATYPEVDEATVRRLSQILGIKPEVLRDWKLNLEIADDIGNFVCLTSLLGDLAVGMYDGRVPAYNTGIAGSVDPNSGGNDPTMTAAGGAYTSMWNVYLNE